MFLELSGAWSVLSSSVGKTVDDINATLPIIMNKEYTIIPIASFKVMQDLYHQQ